MATLVLFDALRTDLWNAEHDVGTQVFKAAFYTSAATFAAGDAAPAYAAGNETTGGQVPAGGVTLDNFTATNVNVDFDDEVISADGANPTNIRFMLIYNDSNATKKAIGFVDFTSDQDITVGATVSPAAAGALTMSVV